MKPMRAASIYYLREAVSALAGGLIFVGLSAYYIRDVGMTPLQLVLVGTAIELTCFLFEVPTGILADTYSRKWSVLLGEALIGVCYIITGLAPFFFAIVIAEVIRGIGSTFTSGAAEAWITDEVGADNVSPLFMRAGQIFPIFNLVGVFASVLLASRFGYATPILLGSAVMLTLAAVSMWTMPEKGFVRPPAGTRHGASLPERMFGTFRQGARAIRYSPVLMLLVGMELFIGASSEGFDRLSEAQYLVTLNLPPLTLPVVGTLDPIAWFALFSLVWTILSVTVLQVAKRRITFEDHGRVAKAMFVMNAVIIAGTLGFALAGNFVVAFGMELVRGVTYSLLRPVAATWMNQNIESRVRATVLSMNGQANALGQIFGGPGIGWIGNALGIRAAIAAAGLLLTPALLLFARTIRGDPSKDSAAEAVEAPALSAK
jgi:DHA3 family tetracycline resistance protein-like MFS transporter